MFLKKLKKFLPETIVDTVQKYRRIRHFKRERARDSMSEEFSKRKRFYSQFLGKGDVYFDVGANYGNRIAPIINLGLERIVAIEPQKKCCEVLKNKYNGITVLQMGVGAEDDVKDLFLANDPVLSSFSTEFINSTKDTRFKGHTWECSERVEIITLDRLIALYGMPDFIKIDVEGYELEVIKGLNTKVKYLSFEYTVPELEYNLEPICQKLHSLGLCEFNYSQGESMELGLQTWKSYDEMNAFLKTKEFRSTGSGDIYVSYKSE